MGKKLCKLGLKRLLLLKNSGLVGQHRTHISANASKRLVRESTGSSRSGVGLEGAASVGGCGGGGGG